MNWPAKWPAPSIELVGHDRDIYVSEFELLRVSSLLVSRLGDIARVPGLVAVNDVPFVVTDVAILGSYHIRCASLCEVSVDPPGSRVWLGSPRNHPRRVARGHLRSVQFLVRA